MLIFFKDKRSLKDVDDVEEVESKRIRESKEENKEEKSDGNEGGANSFKEQLKFTPLVNKEDLLQLVDRFDTVGLFEAELTQSNSVPPHSSVVFTILNNDGVHNAVMKRKPMNDAETMMCNWILRQRPDDLLHRIQILFQKTLSMWSAFESKEKRKRHVNRIESEIARCVAADQQNQRVFLVQLMYQIAMNSQEWDVTFDSQTITQFQSKQGTFCMSLPDDDDQN